MISSGATLARQACSRPRWPLLLVMALKALAYLYNQMREYDKGFEALEEAFARRENDELAGPDGAPEENRIRASPIAPDSCRAAQGPAPRWSLERQIGAGPMSPATLVNLSDAYLKQRDYSERPALCPAGAGTGARMHDRCGRRHRARQHRPGLPGDGPPGRRQEIRRRRHGLVREVGPQARPAGVLPNTATRSNAPATSRRLSAYHRERTLSNELFEKSRQKAMVELQEKYEADKRQRQIELLRQENQVKSTEIDNRRLQQRVWWLLALVFALASVIVGAPVPQGAPCECPARGKEPGAEAAERARSADGPVQPPPLPGIHARPPGGGAAAGMPGEEMVSACSCWTSTTSSTSTTPTATAPATPCCARSPALREILRETDMIVRWGGEEFLAFLPAVPRSSLDEVARRLLAGIPARSVEYQGIRLSVNVSIGFAPFPLAPGGGRMSWERAVNLVDMALYLAKGHGRNRAYGVRGLARLDDAALEQVEQDIEQACRDGRIELSIVHGGAPELRVAS
jgi:hypothetical protein